MIYQFGPSPLKAVWREVVAIQSQEAFLDAILKHYPMPSIEKRLTELKCNIPKTDIDITPIKYDPSDLEIDEWAARLANDLSKFND